MKRATAEPRRRIDFSRAKRGAVVKPQPGKTKNRYASITKCSIIFGG
jgi:hypothetical protein